MDWLSNNPVANMYGPSFLLLYFGFILAVIIGCRLAVRRSDSTSGELPPPISVNPDPYEIAYLRGGPNEVARLVIFDLVRLGYVEFESKGIRRAQDHPDPGQLNELQKAVFDKITVTSTPLDLFKKEKVGEIVRHFCFDYENHLRKERLLAEPDAHARSMTTWGFGAALILGLGVYKLLAAMERDLPNVWFMIIMGGLSILILYGVVRPHRLSARGRAYLERLQAAFIRLKVKARSMSKSAAAADPSTLLLVGLFGAGALAGTPYAQYPQTFQRSAPQSGSSCGGGCGSSGGSSGCSSSCGGGGGSCGGGGCGGCGGGCGGA